VNARDWFLKAQTEGWAIGAFNVDSLEIFKAICIAGKKKKSLVMLEFSPGEVGYFGNENRVVILVFHYPVPEIRGIRVAEHICCNSRDGEAVVANRNAHGFLESIVGAA